MIPFEEKTYLAKEAIMNPVEAYKGLFGLTKRLGKGVGKRISTSFKKMLTDKEYKKMEGLIKKVESGKATAEEVKKVKDFMAKKLKTEDAWRTGKAQLTKAKSKIKSSIKENPELIGYGLAPAVLAGVGYAGHRSYKKKGK